MTPEDVEIILMAKGEYDNVVCAVYDGDEWRDRLVSIVKAIRAEEREACARIAEARAWGLAMLCGDEPIAVSDRIAEAQIIARDIRSRR